MTTTRTRLLTAGAVAAAVALTSAGIGIANAAAGPPPALALVATTTKITAELYDEGDGYKYLDMDLGVNVIAGLDPFEIRATRASYADPIVARQTVVQNGQQTSVVLPAGLVTSFDGFQDFTTVTIKTAAGATVKSYNTNFCPNNWGSARTRRDAPAASPYPTYCGNGNPFLLGSVWGIQAGWNGPTDSFPPGAQKSSTPFTLPVGNYRATVALNPRYRDFWKLTAAQSTVTVDLKVEKYVDDEPDPGPSSGVQGRPGPKAKSAMQSMNHGEGVEHAQIGAYLPDFRPPASIPKSLAAVPATGPKPDLKSLPAWGISLEQNGAKAYVDFGATVWNAGTSPLLVDGFRRTGTELMDAYQYFFDTQGNQVGSVPAGTMQWDARTGHKHWHFTDFAQYNLLDATQKLAVRSGKEAFCLANTDPVDYTVPGAKWRPENTDLSTSCGGNTAAAVREVLDAGNGDTYSQARPGQSFEITGLKNGIYYIQVKANPANKLSELSTTNNTSVRKILLGGTAKHRTLFVPPVYGIKG